LAAKRKRESKEKVKKKKLKRREYVLICKLVVL